MAVDETDADVSDDFLRLIGWFVSEGSLNDGALTLTQAEGQLAPEFAATLDRLGIAYKITRQQPMYAGREHEKPVHYVRTRQSGNLARWFESECGRGAAGKRLPAFVFAASQRQKFIVLNALVDGDGCRRGDRIEYTTVSKRLADDVQRLAILAGMPANIRLDAPGEPHQQPRYTVKIGRVERRSITLDRERMVAPVPYTGLVYCFTTLTGAYLTRRNGQMAVQGNSVFVTNYSRAVWRIKKTGGNADEWLTAGLFCEKRNRGSRYDAIGIRYDFDDQSHVTTLSRADLTDDPELAERMPLSRRIQKALLANGRMTKESIAEATGASLGSVSGTLSRMKNVVALPPQSGAGAGRAFLYAVRAAGE